MVDKDLEKYSKIISRLKVSNRQGKKAPHKAILLLSIMSMVESGELTDNHIVLSRALEEKFQLYWQTYIGRTPIFRPDIYMPFWYMKSELKLWKLVPYSSYSYYYNTYHNTMSPSAPMLKRYIQYAVIPKDFFELIKDPLARVKLAELLFAKYIFIL